MSMSGDSIRSESYCQQKKPKAPFSFSNRTHWNLEPNRLTRKLDDLRKAGIKILDLSESNPTRLEFKSLNQNLLIPFQYPGNLIYQPDPKGLFDARRAICD